MRFYDDPLEISTDTWAEVLMDGTVTEDHTTHAAEVAPHLNYRGHTPVNSQVFEYG
jgi:hypothetical protein